MSPSSPDAERDLVGRMLAGKYRVTRRIGRGGMGAVYEAEHTGIGKSVALKILHPDAAELEGVAERFAREARIVSRLDSAHIVSVLDAGADDDGRPFLVMELLRGEDLGTHLRARSSLDEAEAIRVVSQILQGLADAHEAGVIHRDLKPDNVFLTKRAGNRPSDETDASFVKLVDFGISKVQRLDGTSPLAITQAGTILGTPMYMSPEQAQAKDDIDARTDIYSVGALLFECLAGRPPHVGETDAEVILKICTSDAPDVRTFAPSVSAPVARFVARALARDRGARFRSARQMLVAVSQLGAEPSSAKAAPVATTIVSRERPTDLDVPAVAAPNAVERASAAGGRAQASRTRLAFIAVAATLSGALATAWVVTSQRPRSNAETSAAQQAVNLPAPSAAVIAPAVPSHVSTAPAPVVSAPAPAVAAASAPVASGASSVSAPVPPARKPSPGKPRPSSRGGLDLQRDFE